MANYFERKNKDGKVYAYTIRVFKGTSAEGKKQSYTKTWKIPDGYKSEKAIKRELEKVIGEFETSCNRGEVSTDNKTLAEYCHYYIDTCNRDAKASSTSFYMRLMPLIEKEIGSIKLRNLKPVHLNNFYKKLETEDVKRDAKATGKDSLVKIKETTKTTQKMIREATGLSENTLRLAFQQKRVAIKSADLISEYFEKKTSELFDVATSGVGLSKKYVRHFHSFIQAVLERALKEGVVSRNVAKLASPPKKEKHEAEFFEIEDVLQIKEYLDQEPIKYRLATYLLIDTGIRRGELVGLRWDAIDLENATIRIEKNVVYTSEFGMVINTPKNDECRTIGISEAIIPILKEYKRQQDELYYAICSTYSTESNIDKNVALFNPEGYLFIQEAGENAGQPMHPSSINHWMIKLSERVGMHIHPHKFRHTQASILISGGADLITTSKRLGHKQASTTSNIYAHMLEKADRKASDIIASKIFNQ